MKILSLCGVARYPEDKYRFFHLGTLLIGTSAFVYIFSAWIYVFEDHTFFEKNFSVETTICSIFLCSKLGNLRFRMGHFNRLIADTNRIWNVMREDPENHPIMEEERSRIRKHLYGVMGPFVYPIPVTIIKNTIHNLLCPPDQKELLFNTWDPFNAFLGPEWFILRELYVGMILTAVLLYGLSCLPFMYCTLSAGVQMKVLVRMLRSENLDLRSIVRLHQLNLKYVRDMNTYFGATMIIELVCIAMVISLRSIAVIKALEVSVSWCIMQLSFLISCFADPFILCYGGQVIINMSEAIHRESYQNSWYKLAPADRRTLNLIMLQASQGNQLSYRNFVSFDMVRYSAVCQAAYSYITFMAEM